MLFRRLVGLFAILSAGSTSFAASVFPMDSEWRYIKGSAEASTPDTTAWRKMSFPDSSWTLASAPFWYGDSQPSPGTSLGDMRGGYTCIFMRRKFAVSNVTGISELQLSALSDDGFVAWINGREVARFNVPDGEIPYNGTSLGALQEPIPVENVVISNPAEFLVEGENVIAVQALNSSLSSSSDFVINLSLSSSQDVTPPTVTTLIPPAGATVRDLNQIEVHFSEAVTGVDATDLLINGTPATTLSTFTPSQYVFEFTEPPTGTIQIAWAASHGIRDLAGAANSFSGGNWTYKLDPNAQPPGVIISEFMASNDDTLNDVDGDSSDWIELYNNGTTAANLNGWLLVDNTRQWRFPNVALPASGFLVVFASEKNRTNATAQLHTNFKLDPDGEYLALLDTGGRVVSEFTPGYPQQRTDVSYGRDRFAPELMGYFPTPTPGAPNGAGGPGFAPDVEFSRSGGTFTAPFALTLKTKSPTAVIHFTLDGTLPTEASPVFSQPVNVSATTQVRARAFETGLLPGAPRSETYVLLAQNVVNFTSDLPVVVIHNYGAGAVPANVDQLAFMALFEPVNGKTSLTNRPALTSRAGINIRGSSTQGYPKSSFAVEWWDDFNQNINRRTLDIPADSDWVLYAPNNFEPVLIHNPFIFQISREVGRYAARTRFVEVYLNVNGGSISSAHYNGVYVLMEKIKRDDNRVDIHNLEPEHATLPEVSGGYLMKIDRADANERTFNAAGMSIVYQSPKGPEIQLPQRDPQEQYINTYMRDFGTALNSATFADPINGFRKYVDVQSWVDHHILNVMAFNVDALRLSTFFYKPRNEKLNFGPIWDFDRALGSTDGRDSNPRVWRAQTQDRGTDFFNFPWWGRMFQDLEFWQAWIDRYQDLRESQLSITNMNRVIDELANTVRLAQPRELARWGVQPRNGSYQGEVNYMKTWLASRINFMDTNFIAKPIFDTPPGLVQAGFNLRLQGSTGAILYYTLDGTDPRLPGGAVSPQARIYGGLLRIQQNSRVMARSQKSSHQNLTGPNNPPVSSTWSGLAAGTYYTELPPLVISEIMYHPHAPPAGNTNSLENFEFIEVKNVGTAPLNVRGFALVNRIDFVFPDATLAAGEAAVIVKDLAAFRSRYGNGPRVLGTFTGQLDNGGERIVLEGPLKELLHDFSYNDSWSRITDGFGFSLVIVDATASRSNWANATAWRTSAALGGSPAQDDPPPANIAAIRINEALTHTDPPLVDSIELYNPTSASVNVQGWYLTDDLDRPRKYRISDTPVPGTGFVTIDETQFNSGATGSFSLSSLGDELYLFSADDAGNFTGYMHGFTFGAAENGVPFGRHVISTGQEHFTAQAAPTPRAANSGPKIGPLIINEIMFNPPPSGTANNTIDEFIELRNTTAASVRLFDPNAPTNTWRVAGGVDFTFAENITVEANGYVLLVSFDPSIDLGPLAAFRTRYSLDASVRIFGPYDGKLDNAGNRVRLLKPDPPQTAASANPGFVPYVLVDEVEYSTLAPWPAGANGTGKSLQRRGLVYGNDPANWEVADPTAARANPTSDNPDRDGDGLPNDWELTNNLSPDDATGENGANGDPDGDRVSNINEFTSGTNPRDPASYLRIEVATSSVNGVELRFTAVAGKTYTMMVRQSVQAGDWQKLSDVPAQPDTRQVQVNDPAAPAGTRFYKLVTPAIP